MGSVQEIVMLFACERNRLRSNSLGLADFTFHADNCCNTNNPTYLHIENFIIWKKIEIIVTKNVISKRKKTSQRENVDFIELKTKLAILYFFALACRIPHFFITSPYLYLFTTVQFIKTRIMIGQLKPYPTFIF